MPTGESLSHNKAALALGSRTWGSAGRLWGTMEADWDVRGRPWGPGHHRDTERASLRCPGGLANPWDPRPLGLPASNKHAAVRPQERSSDVRG